MTTWIQTRTGQAFDLLHPDPELIEVRDIAHALSHLCRFTGHSTGFYSVAQHSLLVCDITRDLWQSEHVGICPAPVRLAALLHDAPEAYIGDVSSPLKRALRGEGELSAYDVIERRIWGAVCERFGLETSPAIEALVSRADGIALATERDALLGPSPKPWPLDMRQSGEYRFESWTSAVARSAFLSAFSAFYLYGVTLAGAT